MIRTVAERDIGPKLFLGLTVLVLVASGVYVGWEIDNVEYVNERVVTCTITEKHRGDGTYLSRVDTAQCGALTFPYFRGAVFEDLEAGRTYRLRVADIRPVQPDGAIAITGLEGEA